MMIRTVYILVSICLFGAIINAQDAGKLYETYALSDYKNDLDSLVKNLIRAVWSLMPQHQLKVSITNH